MPSPSQRTERVDVVDGAFELFVWRPDEPAPAVLVLHATPGVGKYIKAVCGRLAAAGYVAAAPDLCWRFAPDGGAADADAGVPAGPGRSAQLDVARAIVDSVAAIAALGDLPEVAGRPAVIGFGVGGTLAWGVAAAGDPSCAVSYYGPGVPSMLDLAPEVHCPVLFHVGDDDPFIPGAGIDAVNDLVGTRRTFALNVEHAGHDFDDHVAPESHVEAAANAAWAKTIAFLETHLPR